MFLRQVLSWGATLRLTRPCRLKGVLPRVGKIPKKNPPPLPRVLPGSENFEKKSSPSSAGASKGRENFEKKSSPSSAVVFCRFSRLHSGFLRQVLSWGATLRFARPCRLGAEIMESAPLKGKAIKARSSRGSQDGEAGRRNCLTLPRALVLPSLVPGIVVMPTGFVVLTQELCNP